MIGHLTGRYAKKHKDHHNALADAVNALTGGQMIQQLGPVHITFDQAEIGNGITVGALPRGGYVLDVLVIPTVDWNADGATFVQAMPAVSVAGGPSRGFGAFDLWENIQSVPRDGLRYAARKLLKNGAVLDFAPAFLDEDDGAVTVYVQTDGTLTAGEADVIALIGTTA